MPSRILRLWNPDASAWEEVGDSRLTAHLAAADPHPAYLTAAEGDTLFLTQSEGDARYAAIGGGGGGAMATDALWDAKGDLAVGSGANAGARLPVGTDGQVLTLDSAQSLGVKWATPAAGGGGGGLTNPMTTKGDLIAGQAGTAVRLYDNYGADSWSSDTLAAAQTTGTRFTPSTGATATAIRWRRPDAVAAGRTPATLSLWDAATGTKIGGCTTISDTGVAGWQESALDSPVALTAGHNYVVASGWVAGQTGNREESGTPGAPPAPLAFTATPPGCYTTAGSDHFPSTNYSRYLPVDVKVTPAAATAPGTPARVPVGTDGQVLTADSAQTLGLRWATQPAYLTQATADPLYLSPTEGDAAYLKLTGGTLTGNLGVGVAPAAWGGGYQALQINAGAAAWGHSTTADLHLSSNTSYDGTNRRALSGTQQGVEVMLHPTVGFSVATAPAVAAGAAQTFTTRLQVAQTGTTTLTPDAGQPALLLASSGNAVVKPSGGQSLLLGAGSGYVMPETHNTLNLGHPSQAWVALFAQTGTISPSSAAVKQDITPLSSEDALAAVRATDPVLFAYKPPERGPEWYELPDDPEQAAQVLEQRLRAAPLEEGARHQAGVVLDHDTYRTDPLFQTGEGQTNPSNGVGILIAAVQALDARLSAGGF